jgi:beta-lactamase regulating signal transducer with metallopeptidase domain
MSESMTLLIWLAKATALLLLAMGLSIGLRRAPAGARYTVWLATLVALLLAPAMSAWSPLPIRMLPGATAAAVPAAALDAAGAVAPAARGISLGSIGFASQVASTAPAPEGLSAVAIALVVWAAVVAVLLLWLALGAFSVRRIIARGSVLTDEAWLTPLYETADRLELDNVPRLMMSGSIEMPFACSIRRPTIVLPASAEQWSDERRRVVLFHELAHIRRRDLVGHTLGRVVCAFYWFHPLVWSAAKQLRAESERACDDLVLSCGARASDYANHLLDIVTGVRRQGAPATALPMANRREFEGRMLAILDPGVKRSSPSRRQTLMLSLGLGSVALTIAAVSPTRREPAMQDQRSASVSEKTVGADTVPPVSSELIAERKRIRSITSERTSTETRSSSAMPSPTAAPSPRAMVDPKWRTDSREWETESRQGPAPDTALLGRVLRTDRSEDVRRAAAWALSGRREGVPLLLERLRLDEDESVREMSAWALVSMPEREIDAALGLALRKDASSEVRETAAWALGQRHRGDNIAALQDALADDNAEVRFNAVWALGQHSLAEVPAKVIGLLQDPNEQVRLITAWVAGQTQDRAMLPGLRAAFLKEQSDDAEELQFRALLFMGERSVEIIDRAMKSDNPELRSRAVRLIGGQGPGSWPWPWPRPQPRPSP